MEGLQLNRNRNKRLRLKCEDLFLEKRLSEKMPKFRKFRTFSSEKVLNQGQSFKPFKMVPSDYYPLFYKCKAQFLSYKIKKCANVAELLLVI